jgi:hypothetical protein
MLAGVPTVVSIVGAGGPSVRALVSGDVRRRLGRAPAGIIRCAAAGARLGAEPGLWRAVFVAASS